jgi:hypothetical protein
MTDRTFPAFSELTWNEEGAPYYDLIKKPSVPGDTTGSSGVTIGPGYDMGGRTSDAIEADMKAAGLSEDDAKVYGTAAGKKGQDARDWVAANPDAPTLSEDQCAGLFAAIYPRYVGEARDKVTSWGTSFDGLAAEMQEVLVDMRYRGDIREPGHTSSIEGTVKEKVVAGYDTFRTFMADSAWWQANTNLLNMKDGSPNRRITARAAWLPETPGAPASSPPASPGSTASATPGTFDLSTWPEDRLYDHLSRVYEQARQTYGSTDAWPTDAGRVTLVCGRGLQDGRPVVKDSNSVWDDTVYVVWKEASGAKRVRSFRISTEYGTEGTSLLQFGLHRYVLGEHHHSKPTRKSIETPGYEHTDYRYRALNPETSVPILLDNDRDLTQDAGEGIVQNSDIYIHYGGSDAATPGGWSAGCQVLYLWDHYKEFFRLVEADASITRTAPDDYGGQQEKTGRALIYCLLPAAAFAPAGLSFPIDLGQGLDPTDEAVAAYHEHTERTIQSGYYPIGANTIWHGGVHVLASEGAPVHACAAGTLVAARLAPGAAGEGPHGSRNFALVRHDDDAGTWYSLSMHLAPLDGVADPTQARWLAPVIAPGETKDGVQYDASGRYVIGGDSSAHVATNFTVSEVLRGTTRIRVDLVTQLQAIRTAVGTSVNVEAVEPSGAACTISSSGDVLSAARARVGQGLASADAAAGGARLAVADSGVDDELLAALQAGAIVTPDRPVAAGDILGWAGQYDVDDQGTKGWLVHWEVFSATSPMVGQDGWTEVTDDNEDFTIDSTAVSGLVQQQWSLDDLDSDNIEAFEAQAFYRSADAAKARTLVCKFVSEWGVPDLDAAIAAMNDVWFTDGIKEQLEPYQWWTELQAQKPGVLPTSPHVFHVNPVAFVAARTAALAGGGAAPPATTEPTDPGTEAPGAGTPTTPPAAGGALALGGSVGKDGVNAPADVQAVKQRLVDLGFDWLTVDTTCDPTLIAVIQLFQSIKDGRESVGGDGRVDPGGDTEAWLNAANAPRWQRISEQGTGFKNHDRLDQTGDSSYGTDWLDATLRAAAAEYESSWRASHAGAALLSINDCSRVHGGDHPDHQGHETGLLADLQLPRTDGASGGITVASDTFDRDAARAMLKALLAQTPYLTGASDLYLNDQTLIDESLCTHHSGHDDHIHVKLHPPPRGAAAPAAAPTSAPSSASTTTSSEGGTYHVVVSGDTLSGIAATYGCPSWRTIYDHEKNADFRALRPNPDLIYPGDRVFVPTA